MWIGTWDGLNKYDGYNFVVYNRENGLSNTTINALLEDDDKNLWIGTEFGLNLLERESGEIHGFFHEKDNSNSLSSNFITYLFQDRSGFIWIGTSFGLNRYDKNIGTFTTYNFFNNEADTILTNFISKVVQDANGLIWIGTHYGLHCFRPETGDFIQCKLELKGIQDVAAVNRFYITDLTVNSAGRKIIASRQGVFIHESGVHPDPVLNKGILPVIKLSERVTTALLEDRKGRLWVGTTEGLDLYDINLILVKHFVASPGTLNLSNNDIKCIYQDPTGAIWIGTYKGLNKVDQSPSRFTHYQSVPGVANSLSDNIVYSIIEDKQGLVWIGTYGGVNLFDRNKKQFSVIRHDPKEPQSISSNKIRTICLDSIGQIWIGTETSGVDRLDPGSGRITHYYNVPADNNSLAENKILSMMVDRKGNIWIGTGQGVNIIDPESGKIRRLNGNGPGQLKMTDNHIWAIYEDRKGFFWLGTNEGLHRISPDLKDVNVMVNKPDNPNSLSVNRIFSIYEDEEGIYWIGTVGGGLNRFDPEKGEFKVYTEENGLPNNVVYVTLEDDEGNLWISTNSGISKFNKQTEVFVNYDSRDGIHGNEFNGGAYFRNSSGEMYFGGMSGFTVFHPSDILINRTPPRIVLTRMEVFNEPRRIDLDDGEVIRLRHLENFFALEFSALDYTNPSKNLYRYKLENYDEDWVFANASQRRAEYRKVTPGTYRFMITGSNNDGVWSTEVVSLTIIVSPPWWKSWIFRIAIAVLTILIAWGFIYLRINNIRKKHDVEKKILGIEKQMFELEQKALRLQMNPHFIFNSLNAIQNFVLSNDTDKAVNYLAKFSHLMRMILANSTATHIPLKDELKALTYYMDLERLRFDDKFIYTIQVDPSIDEEFTEIPPMLFQPYVENAIIHGLVNSPKEGLLEIKLRLAEKGVLRCIIQDNGIGREKAIELWAKSGIKRQPKGMIITQERLQILNKQSSRNSEVRVTDLKDESGNATGTRIELEIQFKEI
jgi:ligand-binding sensor domain-containing protein